MRLINFIYSIIKDEVGGTLAITRCTSNTLITASGFNARYDTIEAIVNGDIDATNIEDDAVTAAKLNSDVVRSGYGLIQHSDGSLYVDVSDTNPCLEITDGGVRVKVDGTTINRTSSGIALVTNTVTDHGSLTGLTDDDHTQYHNTARHDADDHSGLTGKANSGANSDITSLSGLTSLSSIAKVVSYTGNGADDRNIAHGLGRTPILVAIAKTSAGARGVEWWTTGFPAGQSLTISNGAMATDKIQSVDGTNVQVGTSDTVNENGTTYTMFVI